MIAFAAQTEHTLAKMSQKPQQVVAGLLLLLVVAATLTAPADGIRVLGLFPHPAISHFRFFEPVLRGLADAGHDVTVVGLFPWKGAPDNYHDVIIPGDLLTGGVNLQVRMRRARLRSMSLTHALSESCIVEYLLCLIMAEKLGFSRRGPRGRLVFCVPCECRATLNAATLNMSNDHQFTHIIIINPQPQTCYHVPSIIVPEA